MRTTILTVHLIPATLHRRIPGRDDPSTMPPTTVMPRYDDTSRWPSRSLSSTGWEQPYSTFGFSGHLIRNNTHLLPTQHTMTLLFNGLHTESLRLNESSGWKGGLRSGALCIINQSNPFPPYRLSQYLGIMNLRSNGPRILFIYLSCNLYYFFPHILFYNFMMGSSQLLSVRHGNFATFTASCLGTSPK